MQQSASRSLNLALTKFTDWPHHLLVAEYEYLQYLEFGGFGMGLPLPTRIEMTRKIKKHYELSLRSDFPLEAA